jgi:cytochrome c biogenesis protein CcmG/thiol:disulfide interchange protein DsbE
MGRRTRRILQAGALALVASLIALLAVEVVSDSQAKGLDGAIDRGEEPAAPPLELETLGGGEEVSLADYRGKAVVLNFWASWCEPCKREAPLLEAAWRENRDRDVVVLGVNAQDFESDARGFVERYGLTYPILHDGPGSSVGRYGLTGFPETYWVDRRGRLVAHVEGEFTEEELERNLARALGES